MVDTNIMMITKIMIITRVIVIIVMIVVIMMSEEVEEAEEVEEVEEEEKVEVEEEEEEEEEEDEEYDPLTAMMMGEVDPLGVNPGQGNGGGVKIEEDNAGKFNDTTKTLPVCCRTPSPLCHLMLPL